MLTMLAGNQFVTSTPEFWVAVAFFLFVGLLLYYKVPELIGKALDDRAAAIRAELDEARRLRTEAEALLAEYQTKTRSAEEEAKTIVDQARREAELLTAETRKSLSEMLDRRTKLAEEKIARAEAQALSDVRSTAIDTAIEAAQQVMRSRVGADGASQVIDQSIRELKSKLN